MSVIYPKESYLWEYHRKCEAGDIIIGKELMAMLNILKEDFLSEAYQYDMAEAHKRINFIERECKHSISPFAGKPFLLELWQKAYFEAQYSFLMEIENQWLRRFTRTILLVGRKNGKTSLCAADALAEFFCGNAGTNIVCASNDYEQAGIIFEEINNMREESLKLERVSRKNIKGIFMGNPKQKQKKGKFSRQNKATIKKLSAKTGAKEGRNIDKGIIDEGHEMKDGRIVEPIIQSTSTKDEAVINEISTEGFVLDGYWDTNMREARQMLKGEIHRPRLLAWLYTQDSEREIWQDRGSWVKSNPNLGVSKKWHYLDDIVESAKTNSEKRAFVLAKEFNIKQSSAVAWLQEAEIKNEATFDLEEFRDCFYIAGNDFMETTDLCASKLMFKKPNSPVTYFYSHYWIPEAKLELSPDDVDYKEWEREGYLTIVPGNHVESSIVADWKYGLYKEYGVKPFKSGYDNRFARDYISRFEDIFGSKEIAVNVPQNAQCLSNPMRTLEADFRSKYVNYNNCYGDLVCFRNTGFKLDNMGRILPVKIETNKRIDGTAAALCCYAVFEWYKSEFMNLIER